MDLLQVKFIFVLSGFILLYGCAGTVLKPVSPEVEIVNVELAGVNFPVSRVVFSLSVINPNDFDIHVAHANMKFFVKNQLIASKSWTDIAVLHARQKQHLKVPVDVNVLDVLSLMPQLISEAKLPYMITGTVQLKNHSSKLPFVYHGDFSTRPDRKIKTSNRLNGQDNKSNRF